MNMGGMGMLFKSLGIDPAQIQEAITTLKSAIEFTVHSQKMMNEKLDAIAAANHVDLSHIATVEERIARSAKSGVTING